MTRIFFYHIQNEVVSPTVSGLILADAAKALISYDIKKHGKFTLLIASQWGILGTGGNE